MSGNALITILAMAGGAALFLATVRELVRNLKSGTVRGRVNAYRREASPGIFWLSIAATVLAGLIGLIFAISGIAVLASK